MTKKSKKKKDKMSKYRKYKFSEYGPVYVYRGENDEQEITCEPTGVAYYELHDYGISDEPSTAYFEKVEVSDFNAVDENGNDVELTSEEKDYISDNLLEELFENQSNLDLKW